MKSGIRENRLPFIEKLIRLVYPAKCMVCDIILNEDAALYICDACKKNLPCLERKFFKNIRMPYLDGVFAAFYYENGIETAIHNMKYKNHPKLAKTMGTLLYEELAKQKALPDIDCIVPIPMHPKKKRQRGYNQSELVARETARLLGIEVRADMLLKIMNTRPQSLLKRDDRLRNLEKAFIINDNVSKDDIRKKKIFLVDDVLTTGTTINTCAKILKEDGFAFVYALVLAAAEK
ncbi:MAG: ComF family protein [Acetivibrionales bacterium]